MITAKEARALMVEETLSKANENPQLKDWFVFLDIIIRQALKLKVTRFRRELPVKEGAKKKRLQMPSLSHNCSSVNHLITKLNAVAWVMITGLHSSSERTYD